MGDDQTNIVSLTEFRERSNKSVINAVSTEFGDSFEFKNTARMMLNITVFGLPDSEIPLDVLVSATDADSKYNLAALFENTSCKPRLLALAEGLERMSALIRHIHDGTTPPQKA
jgi:hypothetical protein